MQTRKLVGGLDCVEWDAGYLVILYLCLVVKCAMSEGDLLMLMAKPILRMVRYRCERRLVRHQNIAVWKIQGIPTHNLPLCFWPQTQLRPLVIMYGFDLLLLLNV